MVALQGQYSIMRVLQTLLLVIPSFGVRLEDVVVVEQKGDRLQHRSLGPCTFESQLIDIDRLSPQERNDLETYHASCQTP